MKERSILVDCRRPDLGTKYAFFHLRDEGLKIMYLNMNGGRAMHVAYTELLPYSDYPEARLLHDGNAWNVGELNCWLGFAETQSDDAKGDYLDKRIKAQEPENQ